MISWLARRLQLENEETRHALVLGFILFTLTSSYTLVKTARDAFYLAQLPAQTLPLVFLGVGTLTFIAAGVFTTLTRRRSTFETLTGTAMVSAISLAAFSWLFRLSEPWVPVVLYLWVNVYGLLLMSQFWVFTNSVSNPREGKRIFGFVGVGGIVGGLFAGLAAPVLANAWNLSSLMLVAAVLLVVGVAVTVRSVKRQGLPPAEAPDPDPDEVPPLKHSYVRWLAIAVFCSVIVTGVLDYQFKVHLQERYTTDASLASFLGLFYIALNLASLALQLFFTRWALQRLGAGWSAALLPAGVGIGAAAMMALPGFGTVVTTKLWDQMMRQSVNRSAIEMFYFPLEAGLRRRAKSLIEAGLERLGDGFAGGLVLLLAATFGANGFTIALLVSVLVVVWVVAWMRIRAGYVTELGRNLRRMNLQAESVTVSLQEAGVLKEMKRLLDSPYERVVLHALELMRDIAPDRLDASLPGLTKHTAPAVRARAVALGAERQLKGIRERAREMLGDESGDVRVAALRASAALECDDPTRVLKEFMTSDDRRLRLTAMQCAIEFAPASEEHRIRAEVEQIVRDGTGEERAAIAQGLGHRAAPSALHDLLDTLLRDEHVAARRAALRSAGRVKRRRHIQVLIEALDDRATRKSALEGLADYGDNVVGTLGDWLADRSVSQSIRREIPRVLTAVGTAEAVNALFRFREREDVRLSYRILKALNQIRASGTKVRMPRALITEDLQHDARSYLFALVHYRACPIGNSRSAERLLCLALNERMDQALNRMSRRLALLYPPRDIYAAYRGIVSEDRRQRGNAIEYLENALAQDHRQIVLPLVDGSGDEDRLQVAQSRYGMRFIGYNESLKAILEHDDSWLRTCALYVVGARRERALQDEVQSSLLAGNPMVRETALWASQALANG